MVSKWSKPESPAFNVTWFAMKPKIRKEPKGVVLIISPFNYPLWCLLGPVVRLFPLPYSYRRPALGFHVSVHHPPSVPDPSFIPFHSISFHPPPFSRLLAPNTPNPNPPADVPISPEKAGAIAAGCACVMKPSELTPAFSALLADLVPNYLDQSLYRVINGAIPETTKVCIMIMAGFFSYVGTRN